MMRYAKYITIVICAAAVLSMCACSSKTTEITLQSIDWESEITIALPSGIAQSDNVTAATEYLIGGCLTAESDSALAEFKKSLELSPQYAGGGTAQSDDSAYCYGEEYVLLYSDGYYYAVWLNSESRTAYVTQSSLFLRTESVDIGGNNTEWLSVPLPFVRYIRYGTDNGASYANGKFTVTWEREFFDKMCLLYDVNGEYSSLKTFYGNISDNYSVAFDDEGETITLKWCRGGLMHKPDFFNGVTIRAGGEIVVMTVQNIK